MAEGVVASLNFARPDAEENIWSNFISSRVSQQFDTRQVMIRDARRRDAPRVHQEGFQLASAPLGAARWEDEQWVASAHVPACLDLVRSVTGAAKTFLYCPVLIRMAGTGSGKLKAAPPARFVHIDQTPESTVVLRQVASGGLDIRNFSSVSIFNVWRSISAPPQNTPLTLCDIRTVRRELLLTGRTVSEAVPEGIPYLAPVYSDAYRWWFFPEMNQDEAIVFKGVDITGGAMGCMHSAFDVPSPDANAPPRSSIETRVLAFFH